MKGKSVSSPIRGTKTGKPKRLPVSDPIRDWVEQHVDPASRLTGAPLFRMTLCADFPPDVSAARLREALSRVSETANADVEVRPV